MNTKTQIHFYNLKTPLNQRYVNLNFNNLSHSMNKTSLFNSKNLNLKTSSKFYLRNSEKLNRLVGKFGKADIGNVGDKLNISA